MRLPRTAVNGPSNRLPSSLFQYQLFSSQSIEYSWNHQRNAPLFYVCSGQSMRYGQLPERCPPSVPLTQSSVFQIRAIIQNICSSGTACAICSLSSTVKSLDCWSMCHKPTGRSISIYGMFFCHALRMQLLVSRSLAWWTASSVQRMRFPCTEYAVASLLVVDLSDGLELSKGCVSRALSMQLSISGLLAYPTFLIHSNDLRVAFLVHWVCSCRLAGYWPIGCAVVNFSVVSLLSGLPLSQGCVSPAPNLTPITRPRASQVQNQPHRNSIARAPEDSNGSRKPKLSPQGRRCTVSTICHSPFVICLKETQRNEFFAQKIDGIATQN